uniref:Uncharacterized protein n=1 Tax=Siphoviridae sp. ctnks32 TaxID=2826457 RepID=A0A8S5N0Z2_9CAUD|nr:MAG TPA: hypothetical protein [Siphoviridae sp. ctnks32]
MYPNLTYFGIVPPCVRVMQSQPFEVMNDGKGDTVFCCL